MKEGLIIIALAIIIIGLVAFLTSTGYSYGYNSAQYDSLIYPKYFKLSAGVKYPGTMSKENY